MPSTSQPGACVAPVDQVWEVSELVLKVKEPLAVEYPRIRRGQLLFTYLHLAPAPELTQALIDSGATCIAYETVETDDHRLPLLAPMSEVAGRLAPQMGAHALERPQGGRGMLLGGVAGVAPAKVVVLGGGIVGYNAALIAVGMQADVVGARPLDRPHARARPDARRPRDHRDVDDGRGRAGARGRRSRDRRGARAGRARTEARDARDARPDASRLGARRRGDRPGEGASRRRTRRRTPTRRTSSTASCTTASRTCPGAVPISSTRALTNATLPYLELVADRGFERAIAAAPALARGVSVLAGQVTSEPVAEALGHPFVPLAELVGNCGVRSSSSSHPGVSNGPDRPAEEGEEHEPDVEDEYIAEASRLAGGSSGSPSRRSP